MERVKRDAGDLDSHPCTTGCVVWPQERHLTFLGVSVLICELKGLDFLEWWIVKSSRVKIPPLCFVLSRTLGEAEGECARVQRALLL